MTHEIAIEGRFLQDMLEDERKRFTPSELMLYTHVLELVDSRRAEKGLCNATQS